ncbi:MAG: hypothetical protein C0467_13270 [Planctomycetaceae bacterium]|nr:hypothetical protein [Planctomycetaceae bacterium]
MQSHLPNDQIMFANLPETKVLTNYSPALNGIRWTPISGGFSGAEVWRGDDENHGPVFALKVWPPEITSSRLMNIHSWMAQASHLSFVPSVIRTAAGASVVCESGRCWDLARWMPGTAVANPNPAEVEAACVAVARLHQAWPVERTAVCPGVLNRLRVLSEFRTRLGTEPPLHLPVKESQISLVRRAWAVVAERIDWAERLLQPWGAVQVPLAPCVRDLRSEHVFFSRGEVVGIVDYGAMAVDEPTVDLARLLGDFQGDIDARIATGVRAYRSVINSRYVSEEFVRVLTHTGLVCSAVGWLIRLVVEQQNASDEVAVSRRLQQLLGRVGQFAPM